MKIKEQALAERILNSPATDLYINEHFLGVSGDERRLANLRASFVVLSIASCAVGVPRRRHLERRRDQTRVAYDRKHRRRS